MISLPLRLVKEYCTHDGSPMLFSGIDQEGQWVIAVCLDETEFKTNTLVYLLAETDAQKLKEAEAKKRDLRSLFTESPALYILADKTPTPIYALQENWLPEEGVSIL